MLHSHSIYVMYFMFAVGEKTVHVMSEVGVTKVLTQFAENEDSPTGSVLINAGRSVVRVPI